jgi:hypothetical protein
MPSKTVALAATAPQDFSVQPGVWFMGRLVNDNRPTHNQTRPLLSLSRNRLVGADTSFQELCQEISLIPSTYTEADRLECLFFGGFDPHFEGDEPPGL